MNMVIDPTLRKIVISSCGILPSLTQIFVVKTFGWRDEYLYYLMPWCLSILALSLVSPKPLVKE